MVRFIVGTVLLTSLVACAPTVLDARAYDVDTGEVLGAQFTYNYTGSGEVVFEGNGDRLEGEYVTISEGVAGWGTIYGEFYSVSAAQTAQRGTAVATSVMGTGWFVECEYVASGTRGHGVCEDNRGNYYRLLF